MNKSSEMLKAACERKGIAWSSNYAGALGQLLEVFDQEIADAMVQKAVERVDTLITKMDYAESTLDQSGRRLSAKTEELTSLINKAEKTINAMESIKENAITDPKNAEIINLYKQILKSGMDTFGQERMSDSAIESICESASYIVYRTVMGPKNIESDDFKPKRRY